MSEIVALCLVITAVVAGAAAWLLGRPKQNTVTDRERDDQKGSPVRNAAERSRAPRGTAPPPVTQNVVVFAPQALAQQIADATDCPYEIATTPEDLTKALAKGMPAALFVDVAMVGQLGKAQHDLPIIVVLDDRPVSGPRNIVSVLLKHPHVKHVIARPLLTAPFGRVYLKRLVSRLGGAAEHDVLDSASIGRLALLARASHRSTRFERMQSYFSKMGVSERTIGQIYEVAEELVMNALYNAPSEAGYFKKPVSRSEDVELPIDRACEISYGLEGDNAFVRLRDTFGALRHERLLEVLTRCASEAVVLDESRGGAGLGMWRVFSAASSVTITVVAGRLTDILVRIPTKGPKKGKQLLAADLFFINSALEVKLAHADKDEDLDKSVALVT